MGRPLNRHEMRDAYAAAEALGLIKDEAPKRSRREPSDRDKPKADPHTRMRVVWAVCDIGGRTVQTFPYAEKAAAEARAAELKSKKREMHFVRSVKEPISG